jgi:hypothetical protein
MKLESIIPPVIIIGAIGIIGYALLSKPSGTPGSGPFTFTGLGHVSASSNPTNPSGSNYGGSLQMPASGQGSSTSTFKLPTFAVPTMTVNNISQAACPSGCASF